MIYIQIFVIVSLSYLFFIPTANALSVSATITVGSGPAGVAYDSAKGEIFVANVGDNTISVISDTSNAVVATITVGSVPIGVAYDSAKGEIFVANNGDNTISVISDTSNAVVATITVGRNPFAVAYDSAKGEIFVANNVDNTISVISDTSNAVVATVTVGRNPAGVAYDSAKGEIFVANNVDNTISVIADTSNAVVATVTVGSGPLAVAYDSVKGKIFVANNGDNTISVIADPVPSVPVSGHDVTIYRPPSLGNDYNQRYSDGFKISSNNANGLEFNSKTFDIAKYGTTVSQQVLKIGQSVNFTFKIYDERGANTISHVGMYVHFKGDTSVANSDTSIVWDKHDGIKVTDPEMFFSNTTVSKYFDGNFAYVSIKFTPEKVMPDSSILMRMWDDKLSSIDLPINGAIIIVDPNAPVQVKQVPSNQYGDYSTLVSLLDSDGYQMPSILHRIKSGSDLASTVDVYWIYDKGADKLIMVETFKDGTIVGDTAFNLIKKPAEPTLTDHDYVDMPVQNNRQNPEQEKSVMLQEEIKAEKILDAMNIGTRKAP
ncbi:MAG: YncE family protein [Nitrosotalea sp.]